MSRSFGASMGSNPRVDEPERCSVDLGSASAAHDSADNQQLSGWSQWKLVAGKTCRLLWRDTCMTGCIVLSPALIILLVSCLVLLGGSDKYDASMYTSSTMRDAQMATAVSDHRDDKFDVFRQTDQYIGDVLFASATSTVSSAQLGSLCTYVMNTHSAYADAVGVATGNPRWGIDSSNVMPQTCSGSSCGCAVGTQIFTDVASLDAKLLSLAANGVYRPAAAAIVVTELDATSKSAAWNFRYNRTVFSKTADLVDDFTFYASGNMLIMSGALYTPLQRLVDSWILKEFGVTSSSTETISAYFQSTPLDDWEYDPTKFFMLGFAFQWFFGFALIFTLSHMVTSIVEEKMRRIKEGMLMMGLKGSVWWAGWISIYFIIFTIVSLCCTAASFVFVFRNSNFILVWGFIFTFLMSVQALGLLVSTLFSDPGAASIFAIFYYLIGIFVPGSLTGLASSGRIVLCVLCSPFAFFWGLAIFGTYEGSNQGVTFENISDATEQGFTDPIKLETFWLLFGLDALLYLLLAFYFEQTIPGEFGAKWPPWFLCLPRYWCGSSHDSQEPELSPEEAEEEARYMLTDKDVQPVDKDELGEPVLVVKGLRKVFTSQGVVKVAVKNLNLDVYEGQVTALLGHNGAGKSTTFNMLSGLMPPTKGDAVVYGKSIKDDLVTVRKNLGVCPQHDVLWDTLTVMEHLQLFAALKGVPSEKIDQMCYETIAAVGLTEKTHQYSVTLSGGQKRKLSIGIATIGNSKVVYLDEPTSGAFAGDTPGLEFHVAGMDPYSRRSTWQVIKSQRDGHVIIFTTHFMDEADLLGDRIAIMSDGRLRCCGDSLFLKRNWGLGYHLTISKQVGISPEQDEQLSSQLKALVTKHVPRVDLEEDCQEAGAEMSFQLPKGATLEEETEINKRLIGLFSELDGIKAQSVMDSWGISMTTLEEVFLKLARDDFAHKAEARRETQRTTQELQQAMEDGNSGVEAHEEMRKRSTKTVGLRVEEAWFGTHFYAIFMKRFKSTIRNPFNALVQILVPLIFILLACIAIKYGVDDEARNFDVNAGMFNSPLYIPYICSGASCSTAQIYNQIPQLSAGGTTTVGTDATTKPASAQFSCNDYKDSSDLAYNSGRSSGQPSLDIQGVNGVYTDSATSTSVGQITAACAKEGQNSCFDTTGNLIPSSYVCTGTTSDATKMSNYLYQYRKDAGDADGNSKYGALQFNTDTSANVMGDYNYVAYLNGSATYGSIAYANMANNLILKTNQGSSANIALSMQAGPQTDAEKGADKTGTAIVLAFFLIIAFSIVPATFIYELVGEVKIKSKHQQMISGCRPSAYWFGTYAWDFLYYTITMCLAIAMLCAFQQEQFYDQQQFLPLLLIFVLYGMASIPLTYVCSFMFKDQNSALMTTIFTYVFAGFILFLVSWILSFIESTQEFNDKLRYVLYFEPQFAFAQAIYNLQSYYYNDAFNAAVCKCRYSSPWEMGVVGAPLLYLASEAVVFMLLTLWLQQGTTSMGGCLAKLFHRSPEVPPDDLYERDDDVEREMNELDELNLDTLSAADLDKNPIIVRHLRKVYQGRGNITAKVAVKDVSFHVPSGQVFAYLGINGAGKTTSISMMAGEFPPTSGEGKLAGLDMLRDREEINKSMGYCPQFDALFPLLTGREHLYMYARIKGISSEQEESVVDNMIRLMNLGDHEHRQAGGYSGGNKRKLSVAISLMGGPKIVFLDEPSTGMDPEAKRYMWKVIADTMAGRSVILTTHSMEEAEALSQTIGIMVGGRLRCLGTNQHLKDKFGKGYSLEIRCDLNSNPQIKTWIAEIFPESGAVLEEDLGTQLKYQISTEKGNLPLSQAWSRVEEGKNAHGVTEYAISQTSLEQVFVKFAAQQEEETGADANAIAASIKEVIPSFVDMLLCKPKQEHEWTVPLGDGQDPLKVRVEFPFGACLCCKSNPGSVTVNGQPVMRLDDDGHETDQELKLCGSLEPGCLKSGCCGCASCCGCDQCFCCRETKQYFKHSGKLFELIDYNEIPNTQRARPVWLMVDGKEADTGQPRSAYMATVFEKAGKKYCCFVGIPLFILFCAGLLLFKSFGTTLIIIAIIFSALFCTCCICGNWCGRAGHYRNSPDIPYQLPETAATMVTTAVVEANPIASSQQPSTAPNQDEPDPAAFPVI